MFWEVLCSISISNHPLLDPAYDAAAAERAAAGPAAPDGDADGSTTTSTCKFHILIIEETIQGRGGRRGRNVKAIKDKAGDDQEQDDDEGKGRRTFFRLCVDL